MGICSSPAAAGRLERGLNKTNWLEVKGTYKANGETWGLVRSIRAKPFYVLGTAKKCFGCTSIRINPAGDERGTLPGSEPRERVPETHQPE